MENKPGKNTIVFSQRAARKKQLKFWIEEAIEAFFQ